MVVCYDYRIETKYTLRGSIMTTLNLTEIKAKSSELVKTQLNYLATKPVDTLDTFFDGIPDDGSVQAEMRDFFYSLKDARNESSSIQTFNEIAGFTSEYKDLMMGRI